VITAILVKIAYACLASVVLFISFRCKSIGYSRWFYGDSPEEMQKDRRRRFKTDIVFGIIFTVIIFIFFLFFAKI
jgi:hypothetical protein